MNKYYDGFSTHITGITGTGKSYFVKQKFIPLLVQFKPVIVFDYKGEYAGPRAKDANPDWKSYPDIDSFFSAVKAAGKLTQSVYVIGSRRNQDYIRGLSWLEHIRAQVSVILDEAQFIFLDNNLSQAKTPLVKMVRSGRADGTDVIMVSQRTMDMPPDIRSQFTRRISFRQKHDEDVKVIYRSGAPDAEKIKKLKPREYEVFGSFPDHIDLSEL